MLTASEAEPRHRSDGGRKRRRRGELLRGDVPVEGCGQARQGVLPTCFRRRGRTARDVSMSSGILRRALHGRAAKAATTRRKTPSRGLRTQRRAAGILLPAGPRFTRLQHVGRPLSVFLPWLGYTSRAGHAAARDPQSARPCCQRPRAFAAELAQGPADAARAERVRGGTCIPTCACRGRMS